VTLALTPEEVAALSLAKSTGTILLSLRNPQDTGDLAVPPMVASGSASAASAPPVASVARPVTRRAAAPPPRARTAPQRSSHQVDLVIDGRQQVLTSESSR
jgi:pilus assembly protein CpaB